MPERVWDLGERRPVGAVPATGLLLRRSSHYVRCELDLVWEVVRDTLLLASAYRATWVFVHEAEGAGDRVLRWKEGRKCERKEQYSENDLVLVW